MLPAVRVELLNPRAQRPGYQYLLQRLSANIQSLLNQINSTGRAWAVGDMFLTVAPGKGEYILNAVNIGRILDVNTYDPSSSNWIERQIPFYDYSQMTEHWDKVRDVASWAFTSDGGPHTAMRIAFFRKSGLEPVYAKILPIPQQAAQYRISYTIQDLGGPDTALDVEPLLSNHHWLLILETAKDALPATVWSDDKEGDQQTRNNLKDAFEERLAIYRNQFIKGVASLTHPRSSTRRAQYGIDG